jgi:hypothetical protein
MKKNSLKLHGKEYILGILPLALIPASPRLAPTLSVTSPKHFRQLKHHPFWLFIDIFWIFRYKFFGYIFSEP